MDLDEDFGGFEDTAANVICSQDGSVGGDELVKFVLDAGVEVLADLQEFHHQPVAWSGAGGRDEVIPSSGVGSHHQRVDQPVQQQPPATVVGILGATKISGDGGDQLFSSEDGCVVIVDSLHVLHDPVSHGVDSLVVWSGLEQALDGSNPLRMMDDGPDVSQDVLHHEVD